MNAPKPTPPHSATASSLSGHWRQIQDTANRVLLLTPPRFRVSVGIARQFVTSCLGDRLPVVRLRGRARLSGQPATLLVAGKEPWVNYLPGRFFAEPPTRELIDRVSAWSLPGVLRQLRPSADMTVARVDRLSVRMLYDGTYLRVPEWVGARLDLPENLDGLFQRNRNVREDMKRVCKNRFRPVISRRESDLDQFYKTMYVPYVRARFHDLGFVRPYPFVRQLFRQGGLVFAERDGERLAGSLFARHKDVYKLCIAGTRDGQQSPVWLGALAALKIFDIQHARDLGCTRLEFGSSRSVLQDGVLRFKSKWGARFYNGHTASLFELLVHWNRFDAVVAEFISHTSPIFIEKNEIAGLHVTAENRTSPQAAHKALWVDGLSRLYLIARDGWPSDVKPPPRVTLLNAAVRPECFSGSGNNGRCHP